MIERIITSGATALLLSCVLLLNGCVTPVGVRTLAPQEAYEDLNASPLEKGVAGEETKYVLRRYALQDRFENEPANAIAALHEKALGDERRDILYSLAELSYLYGQQLTKSSDLVDQGLAPDYFLLSAIYAYYFFLEERSEPRPTAFDRRARIALDLYNFGLWQGLATGEEGGLELEETTRKLPMGQLKISLDTSQFPWEMEQFQKFEPAQKYLVRGISVRNRTSGVGAPLIALRQGIHEAGQASPVTVFLRMHGNLASLSDGTATASLEVYSAQDSSTLTLNNRTLPLETDTTAPLAYKLQESKVWSQELSAFLGTQIMGLPNGLYLQQPYRAGRIPVVFVHGTASSPVWWVEMFNTLNSDPLVRQKYQFWYFVYTSSEPVAISAANLRDALREKVASLDPQGKDLALQQMVVVGHSQGGLLTKLCAVDTGASLITALTGKDLDALKMSQENKERARRLLYVKPLPFVKEVVFLSTPHRGSFRSVWWARKLLEALVTFPATLVEMTSDYYNYFTDDVRRLLGGRKTLLTSAFGQSKENPLLKSLADIPLAQGVKGHSIISVKDEGDPRLGNDGVVEYSSAHIEGMASELIVRGDHSSQLNPLAIDEVRRILVEHLKVYSGDSLERR